MYVRKPDRPGTTHQAGNRRGALIVGALLALIAVLALAACGSSSSSSSSTTEESPAASEPAKSEESSGGAGVEHAEEVVEEFMAPVTYETPTEPVKNVSANKGKTVVYIPLVAQIPSFALVGETMQESLGAVGMKEQTCDGGGNPSQVAACIEQAIGTQAVGIVTDAIPYEMAESAFKKAIDAGIKVVIADQIPTSHAQKGKLEYQEGSMNQPLVVANWIIADSQGKANAIISKESDSPTSAAMVDEFVVPAFEENCPECTIEYKPITATSPQALASEVNSNVLKNPNVQYYYTEFEDSLEPTLQGLQQSGKINSIKVASAAAGLGGLQKMASEQAVYAEASSDSNYSAWADTDMLLRMLGGQPTAKEIIPVRLFTRENVGEIELTPAGASSGEWYGDPNEFKVSFKKLWGVG